MYSTFRQLEVFGLFILLSLAFPVEGSPATENPQAAPYRIGPGDNLQIDVWKEPEASIPSVTVRPDGRISVPILGDIDASGATPEELQVVLAAKYGALIRDARVTVLVKQAVVPKIYVIGEVRREGPVRMETPLTILQALAEAGGLTDFAKRRKIYILRVLNGRRDLVSFDYDAVVRGERLEQNVVLRPGDTIVVPR